MQTTVLGARRRVIREPAEVLALGSLVLSGGSETEGKLTLDESRKINLMKKTK